MPLFIDSICSLLPSTSSTDPTTDHHHRPSNLSFPSDAISELRTRTSASGEGRGLLSVEESSTPRHAETYRPSQKPAGVRSLLRQAIPRGTLGMRLPGGEPQTRNSKQRQSSSVQDDESRLFPNYGTSTDAVPIVPGEISRKKKSSIPGGFKPYDTLSKRSRDSGPVPARGKQGRRNNRLQPAPPAPSFPYSDNVLYDESPERPLKRQRRDSNESAPGNLISVSDDDIMDQAAPENSSIAGNSRLSTTSSQQSVKHKKPRRNNRTDEFRSVEKSIKVPRISPYDTRGRGTHWSPDEEQFTEAAAQERRSSRFDTPHDVLQSVEVPGPGKYDPTERNTRGWRSDYRSPDEGSPDELQGEATVQPAPKSLLMGPPRAKHIRYESEVEESSLPRSSPSNIRPTIFESSRQGSGKANTKKKKPKRRDHPQTTFKIAYLHTQCGLEEHDPDGQDIVVDQTSGSLSLSAGVTVPILKNVTQIIQESGPSCKVRLVGPGSLQTHQNTVYLKFMWPTAREEFCALYANQGVKIRNKDSGWMEKAFVKSINSKSHAANGSVALRAEDNANGIEDKTESKPEPARRKKITDFLQDEKGSTSGEPQDDPPKRSNRPSSTPPPQETSNSKNTRSRYFNAGVSNLPFSGRSTRSSARRAQSPTIVCDDGDDDHNPTPKPNVKFKKWHKPLVYPRFGKKKAEVDAHDRERLRDNEFLNDNLIGFYIRFLEEHLHRCNQEVARRVYFFNSYFFDRLTDPFNRSRGINYEGVEKWTRNVDLFSFDYVVVPINESAHWYVAIICNLPSLQGLSNDETELQQPTQDDNEPSQPDSQVHEVPETPEPDAVASKSKNENGDSDAAKEEVARQSLASMSLGGEPRDASQGDEDWPEHEENPSHVTAKFSSPAKPQSPQGESKSASEAAQPQRKGQKKKQKRKSQPPALKHDTRQPIIITFDSLNLARSSTIKVLCDYVTEEAKSKRGVSIDSTSIKGMKARAKQIPLQPNYSDCGLYLLAYVEKFVQDPDLFVGKILQNEMKTEEDWPPLKSGLLRQRLRIFLDDLYDEQEQMNPEKASEKTNMADQQPVTYLLGPSVREDSKAAKDGSSSVKEDSKDHSEDGVEQSSKKDAEKEDAAKKDDAEPETIPESVPQDSSSGLNPDAEAEAAVSAEPDQSAASPAPNEQPHKDEEEKEKPPQQPASASSIDPSPSPHIEPASTEPQKAEREIIEVPDSQEPVRADPPPPEVVISKRRKASPKPKYKARASTPEKESTGKVEVLIPGTPPKKGKEKREKRSPRTGTGKKA